MSLRTHIKCLKMLISKSAKVAGMLPFVMKGAFMKCPKCRKDMQKKNKDTTYWWECPSCHTVIGHKPKEDDNA